MPVYKLELDQYRIFETDTGFFKFTNYRYGGRYCESLSWNENRLFLCTDYGPTMQRYSDGCFLKQITLLKHNIIIHCRTIPEMN